MGHQVDSRAFDAGRFGQRALNVRLACGACHALDRQRDVSSFNGLDGLNHVALIIYPSPLSSSSGLAMAEPVVAGGFRLKADAMRRGPSVAFALRRKICVVRAVALPREIITP